MAKKQTVETGEFVNPYGFGVGYDVFLAAIPEGVTVQEYCEGKLTQEQIDFVINDLKHYKTK